MIYTFNNKDYLLFPVAKSVFSLSETEIYNTILEEFNNLIQRLENKGISYDDLKGALIPNQDKKKFETCFIFDTSLISSNMYGYFIFEKVIPLLDKKSTYSIMCGDYIDISKNTANSQFVLRNIMNEVLTKYNKTNYRHSNQYYLIYFNRLTVSQRCEIVEGLLQYPWFIGFADLTHTSTFKSYISQILTHTYIKHKDKVIAAHPMDYSDEENINMLGYPFEKNDFKLISINEENFGPFLSYKIETDIPDKTDIGFSFNALFPKFDSIDKLKFLVEDKKWTQYLTDCEKGKGNILKSLGYETHDKEIFIKKIYKQICHSYIYNLDKNDQDVLKFNVCLDLPTINGKYRKTTVALKYEPNTGEISVITIT